MLRYETEPLGCGRVRRERACTAHGDPQEVRSLTRQAPLTRSVDLDDGKHAIHTHHHEDVVILRIDMPSTRHPMICALFSVLSRFILNIMLAQLLIVKL